MEGEPTRRHPRFHNSNICGRHEPCIGLRVQHGQEGYYIVTRWNFAGLEEADEFGDESQSDIKT